MISIRFKGGYDEFSFCVASFFVLSLFVSVLLLAHFWKPLFLELYAEDGWLHALIKKATAVEGSVHETFS